MKAKILGSSILLLAATAAHAAPQPQDDYLITVEDQAPLIFTGADLMANDGCGPGAVVVIDSGPQFGTLGQQGGQFTYSPDEGFVGEDQLTYQVTFGIQTFGPAVVTIKVSPEIAAIAGNFDDVVRESLFFGWLDNTLATIHLCPDYPECDSYPVPPGLVGLTPIVGDWDANGVDDVGLYDPASGTFYLLSLSQGVLVIGSQFQLGTGGGAELPLAGDWDGDGDDTVGLYRPGENRFLLRNKNTPGPFHFDIVFGHPPGEPHPLVVKGVTPASDAIGHYDEAQTVLLYRALTHGATVNEVSDCATAAGTVAGTPVWAGVRGDGNFQIWLDDPSRGKVKWCNDGDPTGEFYIPPTG